jgi:AAA family ATP:ADP antiporter
MGYSAMAFLPVLWLIGVGKVAENSIDYSIQTTARQALYLVTSREAKYTAKALIDTFFQRFGDVCAAGIVFAGTSVALSTKGFVFANIALVLVWFGVLVFLTREHKKREAAAEQDQLHDGEGKPAASPA